MYAVKGNKVYTVSSAQTDQYQRDGYDIYDGGELVAYGVGKTVPYADFKTLEADHESLRAEYEKLKAEHEKAKAQQETKTAAVKAAARKKEG